MRALLVLPLLAAPAFAQETPEATPEESDGGLTVEEVSAAGRVAGLEFTEAELELMFDSVRRRLRELDALRGRSLTNDVFPAPTTTPWIPGVEPAGAQFGPAASAPANVVRPDDLEEVASWSIPELAALLRQGDVTSVELTEMYLARLERLDEHLHCVITLMPERALAQARERDAEMARGEFRGLLHGIPWGVKDLMAVEGYRTTWGAKPFEDQVVGETAEVVRRLDEAGAVLIAKLSVGALAMGDVWFGERTRSPWDLERGSSGSSAGSASATAAGGVAFALGTETLGSIVSPSVACSTSALRPTFGRVPRTGTMALSWTMDKVGPITRTVEDAALVFEAIRGADPADPYSHDGRVPVTGGLDPDRPLRIGVPEGAFRRAAGLETIRAELEGMGHELVPIELPRFPTRAMLVILNAEAAAAFDELTRSGRDDELVRQDGSAWPNSFRASRLIPAVEYVQAQRLRTLLMRAMDEALAEVDLIVHAPYAAGVLTITNLTGHPTVAAPFVPEDGPRGDGSPATICFTGHLDRDEQLLAAVAHWQRAYAHHVLRPPLEWLADDADGGGGAGSDEGGR
jgi:Asp-tRNA(Asn)/Glu-tRNA(Gln) amidotransferase A subunit family amidase